MVWTLDMERSVVNDMMIWLADNVGEGVSKCGVGGNVGASVKIVWVGWACGAHVGASVANCDVGGGVGAGVKKIEVGWACDCHVGAM